MESVKNQANTVPISKKTLRNEKILPTDLQTILLPIIKLQYVEETLHSDSEICILCRMIIIFFFKYEIKILFELKW